MSLNSFDGRYLTFVGAVGDCFCDIWSSLIWFWSFIWAWTQMQEVRIKRLKIAIFISEQFSFLNNFHFWAIEQLKSSVAIRWEQDTRRATALASFCLERSNRCIIVPPALVPLWVVAPPKTQATSLQYSVSIRWHLVRFPNPLYEVSWSWHRTKGAVAPLKTT